MLFQIYLNWLKIALPQTELKNKWGRSCFPSFEEGGESQVAWDVQKVFWELWIKRRQNSCYCVILQGQLP